MRDSVHTYRMAAMLRASVKWAAALLLLALCNPAFAQPNLPDLVNLQHTLQVRKALAQDSELATLSLGVKVENRVATLWGPVPSSRLLNKAFLIAREVPDILQVRCEMYLDASAEPEQQYLPNAAWNAVPSLSLASSLNAPEPGTAAVENASSQWKRTGYLPGAIEIPAHADDPGLFVLPAGTVTLGVGEIELPVAASLQDRVLPLKGTDPRYQYLHVLVEEDRVYLSGYVSQWSDLHSLTKAIAQLPGVGNVIIGQVQAIRP